MKRLTLTSGQQAAIEQAKRAGKKRIVLTLTDAQRLAERKLLEDIENEKEELKQQALQAIAQQRDRSRNIAECLKSLREAAGMSLADVAARAGMTKQAVFRIETGENCNPKLDTLSRIAEALGKTIRVEVY